MRFSLIIAKFLGTNFENFVKKDSPCFEDMEYNLKFVVHKASFLLYAIKFNGLTVRFFYWVPDIICAKANGFIFLKLYFSIFFMNCLDL